ncbi:14701_t:CDS:2, partial [Dentiscutata erythropus]
DCNLVRESIHGIQTVMWSASDKTNSVYNVDLHQLLSDIFPIWITMKKQANVKKIKSYPAPSTFALLYNLIDHHVKDKQLLIHRPPECVGPPVQIYHNVFSQFLRDYRNEDLEMGREHYQWTLEFIHEMAKLYPSEADRSEVFKEKMRELFGEDLITIQLEDKSSNYGIKNEIGTGSCDPTVQAGASFAKYYTQKTYREALKWCNWPSFILCLAGPWVCILGAVYVEKPIVDPLTDFIPLIPTNNRVHAEQVARLFKALYLGVNRLKEYYLSLDKPISQNLQRFFPYPNQYVHQGTTVEFAYEGKLLDHKLLWKAVTKDGQKIIVKFAWQYNQRAHELCSEIGKAPKLFYINKEVVDGFYMVVMDYIEAVPLYYCDSLSHDEYKTILECVEEAIDKLHDENIVFADLRDSNILVNKSQGQLMTLEQGSSVVDGQPEIGKEAVAEVQACLGKLPVSTVDISGLPQQTDKQNSVNTKVIDNKVIENKEIDDFYPEEPANVPHSVMTQFERCKPDHKENDVVPEVPASPRTSEEKKMDFFLDEVNKKRVGDEIRQRNREKKLLHESANQEIFLNISSVKTVTDHDDRCSPENSEKHGNSVTNRDDQQKIIPVTADDDDVTELSKNQNIEQELTKELLSGSITVPSLSSETTKHPHEAHHAPFAMESIGIMDYMANGIEMEQNIALLATVQAMNSSS